MQVKTITVEFGMTQNLGDYSNVRPLVAITADLDQGDDPAAVLQALQGQVRTEVETAVDTALEQAGQSPRFYQGTLFTVFYSEVRRCVVIVPSDTTLPHEATWRDEDKWRVQPSHPRQMRLPTALHLAQTLAQQKGYALVDGCDGSLTDLPPLPDAGPEPVWHQKGVGRLLRWLGIEEAQWEALAALSWVTPAYLREVRTGHSDLSATDLVALIGTNQLLLGASDDEEE